MGNETVPKPGGVGPDAAQRCQSADLLPVGETSSDQADDGHVVFKFGAVSDYAVMCEQRVQVRAEHAALRGTSVKSRNGGCGVACLHSLASVFQEVRSPITEGGVEPKVSELTDELGGHNGVKC